MKKWLAGFVVLILAAIVMSGYSRNSTGSSAAGASNNKNEMSAPKLKYIASNIKWDRNGKLIVEGAFYNLSSEYDILELEDAVIYVQDSDGNILTTVNVNETYVGKIPHNGSASYNFIAKNIEDGSNCYSPWSLRLVLECSLQYDKAKRSSLTISGGGNSSRESTGICEDCGGMGHGTTLCTSCLGSGIDPTWEMTKGSVLHAFAEKECADCGGSGFERCISCRGSGKN